MESLFIAQVSIFYFAQHINSVLALLIGQFSILLNGITFWHCSVMQRYLGKSSRRAKLVLTKGYYITDWMISQIEIPYNRDSITISGEFRSN